MMLLWCVCMCAYVRACAGKGACVRVCACAGKGACGQTSGSEFIPQDPLDGRRKLIPENSSLAFPQALWDVGLPPPHT